MKQYYVYWIGPLGAGIDVFDDFEEALNHSKQIENILVALTTEPVPQLDQKIKDNE